MEKTNEERSQTGRKLKQDRQKRRGLSRIHALFLSLSLLLVGFVWVAGTTLRGCRVSVATLSHRTACQASLSSYTHATPVTTIYLTSVDGHSNEPPRYDSPFLSCDRSLLFEPTFSIEKLPTTSRSILSTIVDICRLNYFSNWVRSISILLDALPLFVWSFPIIEGVNLFL